MASHQPATGTDLHVVPADHLIYAFEPVMKPTIRVPDGARVEVHCLDGLGGWIQTETDLTDILKSVDLDQVLDQINGITGPIYVEGANPGDVLEFAIEAIDVEADHGCTLFVPGFGLQQDKVAAARTRISAISGNSALVLGRIPVQLRPMIGTIGVAPASERWTTMYPHDHGGNLDTSDIRAGSSIYLPVHQPGALLALGDAKAVMGDGEVCGSGIEVPVRVTGQVNVIKTRQLHRPLIRTETEWMTLGSAEDLMQACKLAHHDMVELLAEAHNLDWEDAYILSSIITSLRISQVVDPYVTVRCCVSKKYLEVFQPGPGT